MPTWIHIALNILVLLVIFPVWFLFLSRFMRRNSVWERLPEISGRCDFGNAPRRRCLWAKIDRHVFRFSMTVLLHDGRLVLLPSWLFRVLGWTPRAIEMKAINMPTTGSGKLHIGGKWHEFSTIPASSIRELLAEDKKQNKS